MTEVFMKYGPAPVGAEQVACVVAHPDAGGPCPSEAVGEVWSLPFCEIHGYEAELAAREELAESAGNELEALFDVEIKRYDTNRAVTEALERAEVPSDVDREIQSAAMRAAYPPDDLEGNIDADTLSFDYEKYGRDTPHDWWYEARVLLVRFMRQAAERGVPIVGDLEYLRERATVQELLAERDMDRRWRATKARA